MDPVIWGPPVWDTIRNVVLTTNPSVGADARVTFVRSLAAVLPCSVCITHFAAVLVKYPPEQYFATQAGRETWYKAVRAEVKRNEAPKKVPYVRVLLTLLAMILAVVVVGRFITKR